MDELSKSHTRSSLLERLQREDRETDWDDFCRKYAPLIYGWCRRHGLGDADAQDVTQDVLLRLLRALKTFHYDSATGKFRAWLRTVTQHAIVDLERRPERRVRGTGDESVPGQLERIPDREDFVERLVEAMLIEQAESRARESANPWYWQAYLLWKTGMSRTEIAEQLDQTARAVSVAIHRITKEVARILGELEAS